MNGFFDKCPLCSNFLHESSPYPLLPPLRERAGDVPLLAWEFLRRFNKENGTSLALEQTALSVLASCRFPGNVRELENCVRRTATFAQGGKVVGSDFACRSDVCLSSVLWRTPANNPVPTGFAPLPVVAAPQLPAPSAAPPPARPVPVDPVTSAPRTRPAECSPEACDLTCPGGVSEWEKLIEAMEMAGWVQAKAARLLGLTPRQIGYALRKNDIPIKRF